MSERDDQEDAPVVTVSSSSDDTTSSTTVNLPATNWPPTKLADLMTRKLITVGEHEPVGDLEAGMQRFRFHHLPVVDAEGKLLGLITQTDYLHARLGVGPDGRKREPIQPGTLAGAMMRKSVVFGRMDDTLDMACEVMLREKLGCLPVVLDDKTLVGMVTTTDFVRLAYALLERG